MKSTIPDPLLFLSMDQVSKMHDVNLDQLADLWNVFTKCAEVLESGRRLENLSWRLWFREAHLMPADMTLSDLASPNASASLSLDNSPLPTPLNRSRAGSFAAAGASAAALDGSALAFANAAMSPSGRNLAGRAQGSSSTFSARQRPPRLDEEGLEDPEDPESESSTDGDEADALTSRKATKITAKKRQASLPSRDVATVASQQLSSASAVHHRSASGSSSTRVSPNHSRRSTTDDGTSPVAAPPSSYRSPTTSASASNMPQASTSATSNGSASASISRHRRAGTSTVSSSSAFGSRARVRQRNQSLYASTRSASGAAAGAGGNHNNNSGSVTPSAAAMVLALDKKRRRPVSFQAAIESLALPVGSTTTPSQGAMSGEEQDTAGEAVAPSPRAAFLRDLSLSFQPKPKATRARSADASGIILPAAGTSLEDRSNTVVARPRLPTNKSADAIVQSVSSITPKSPPEPEREGDKTATPASPVDEVPSRREEKSSKFFVPAGSESEEGLDTSATSTTATEEKAEAEEDSSRDSEKPQQHHQQQQQQPELKSALSHGGKSKASAHHGKAHRPHAHFAHAAGHAPLHHARNKSHVSLHRTGKKGSHRDLANAANLAAGLVVGGAAHGHHRAGSNASASSAGSSVTSGSKASGGLTMTRSRSQPEASSQGETDVKADVLDTGSKGKTVVHSEDHAKAEPSVPPPEKAKAEESSAASKAEIAKRKPVTFTMGGDESEDEDASQSGRSQDQSEAHPKSASVKKQVQVLAEEDDEWSSDESSEEDSPKKKEEELFKKVPIRSKSAADIRVLPSHQEHVTPGPSPPSQPVRGLLSSIFNPEAAPHPPPGQLAGRPHASAADLRRVGNSLLQMSSVRAEKENSQLGQTPQSGSPTQGSQLPRARSNLRLSGGKFIGDTGGLRTSKSAVALPLLNMTASRSTTSMTQAAAQAETVRGRPASVVGSHPSDSGASSTSMHDTSGSLASSLRGASAPRNSVALAKLNELAAGRSSSTASRRRSGGSESRSYKEPLILPASVVDNDYEEARLVTVPQRSDEFDSQQRGWPAQSHVQDQARSEPDSAAATPRQMQHRLSMPLPVELPDGAAPQTPRTTRRNMLRDELSESLRQNLLWERQSRNRMLGIVGGPLPQPTTPTVPPAPPRKETVLGGGAIRPLTSARTQSQTNSAQMSRESSSSSGGGGGEGGRQVRRTQSEWGGSFHHTGW